MVAVLLLLGLEFVCLGLLALVRFRAAGLVLIDLQLQRLLVVLGVALTADQEAAAGTAARTAAAQGAAARVAAQPERGQGAQRQRGRR